MPWSNVKLNDGRVMPDISFGSSSHTGQDKVSVVGTAIEVGFNSIDTAQAYGSESSVGQAIKESGLSRKDIWITTKWSRSESTPHDAAKQSLSQLGTDYVDLYLVHSPQVCGGDISGKWAEIEAVQKKGWAKSIGVSNFTIPNLTILLASSTIKPAVNQIRFSPDNLAEMAPLLAFHKANGIVTEGYSVLGPLWKKGSRVLKVINAISEENGLKPEEVLLAWTRQKGVVPVTASTNKSRMITYIGAGDVELSPADIAAIDKAGLASATYMERKRKAIRAAKFVLVLGFIAVVGGRLLL